MFKVKCDTNGIGIGVVLTEGKRPIAHFTEKLNDLRKRCNTYDEEFYVMVRALNHWSHYLSLKQFVLHLDHQTFKFINGQYKLNSRYAKLVEFLQSFSFVSNYKQGVNNMVTDALSRTYSLLALLDARVLGFSLMRNCYINNDELSVIMTKCHKGSVDNFCVQDGSLFKGNKLCVPNDSFKELLVRETHRGGLAGHFGINNTLEILKEHFYWPKMQGDL